jgi:hypothetical protein
VIPRMRIFHSDLHQAVTTENKMPIIKALPIYTVEVSLKIRDTEFDA